MKAIAILAAAVAVTATATAHARSGSQIHPSVNSSERCWVNIDDRGYGRWQSCDSSQVQIPQVSPSPGRVPTTATAILQRDQSTDGGGSGDGGGGGGGGGGGR
jgi:uncharacterized membrane protein YgcG